jgi:putative glutamine amidotransferase
MVKLGVSACFFYPDPGRAVFQHKSLTYLENDMARYLTQTGVLPILLPDVGDQLEAYLDEVDGVVFQGGSDLAPSSYGEEPIENGRWPGDAVRDRYELDVMDRAAKRGLPVYGICRGAQLLNVWHGGTLYQDLVTQTGTTAPHRNPELYDRTHHTLTCTPGGELARIYGRSELSVNSIHHQGIKRLGDGLRAEATCPDDGLVEAFTATNPGRQYVLGVQWHPEFSPTLGDRVADPMPLLDHFLDAVRARS